MSKKLAASERFAVLGSQLGTLLPHLNGVLSDETDFISLQIKLRPDGTCLAVLKKYGDDGRPLVLFGSGYGVPGALMGTDSAVQGGRWRPDKPFKPKKT